MKSILLIDDDDDFRAFAIDRLLDAGLDVWGASCPEAAYPLLHEERFDLIVCDLHMPFTQGEDETDYKVSFEVGLRTAKELHKVFPDTKIIALSAAEPTDLRRIEKFLSPVSAYSKPFHLDELVTLVKKQLEKKSPSERVLH